MRRGLLICCFGVLVLPSLAFAQSSTAAAVPDTVLIEKAVVLDMSDQHTATIPGTGTSQEVQTLRAQVLSGPDAGQTVTFENDYTQLNTGDVFYIRHDSNALDGVDYWTVSDPYRLNVLLGLALVFLALLFIFGGLQGLRGLISLAASIALIFYLLLPGILAGYSVILVSVGVSAIIIILGSFITHGFNRTTSAAVIGMLATVVVTGLGTYFVIHAAKLSGFTTEENVYLNFDTSGGINMLGLLFGGIMIGLLGVLYDIAIGQAVAVEELFAAGTHLSHLDVYRRAIRIGREHIGALVNTLAIAYVGVALPLLLLAKETSTQSLSSIINGEIFATEIVRILMGGIGIILAVPLTTLVATYMLMRRSPVLAGK